jgi:hypothetical protein
MKCNWRSAVVVIAALTTPLVMGATPQASGEINDRNVRQAEAKAKSAEDHLKIADYYQSQTKLMQVKLAEAEDLVTYWSSDTAMVHNRNVPSPYWSAKSHADRLRAEVESASAHAAEQQKLAQSARVSGLDRPANRVAVSLP